MANNDNPFGLKPVGHMLGLSWSAMIEKCYVSASYGTALFPGDPVDINPTLAQKDPTAKYQSVERASAGTGEFIYGVIASVEPDPDNLSRTHIPASTGGYVYVITDPYVLYHIQDDGAATPAKDFVGQNAVLIITHSGDTLYGKSGMELDSGGTTAPAADDGFQLYIRRLADLENNTLGANAVWEVMINTHRLRATGDGSGMLGVTSS